MEVFNLDFDIPTIELTQEPDRSTWWQPKQKKTEPTPPKQVTEQTTKPNNATVNKPQNISRTTSPPQYRLPGNYRNNLTAFIQEVKKLDHATNLGRFKFDHKYAKAYAKDYKSILGKLRFEKGFDASDWQDTVKMTKDCARPELITLFGAPGATKSSGLLKLIKKYKLEQLAMALTVVCPRVEQHKDWMSKLQPVEDFMVKTFETVFRQPVAELVIVEELGQTPAAWIDALVYTRPNIRFIIVLGDFKQNVHYESHPEALTKDLIPTIDRLMVNDTNYLNESYRLAPNQCNKLNIKCKVDRPDCEVRVTYHCDPHIPVLASSDSRSQKLSKSGFSRVMTYPGAQGSDFKNDRGEHITYALQINKDCLAMSERCWFTAITRSNKEILLWVEDTKIIDELEIQARRKPSLKALLEMLAETTAKGHVDVLSLRGSGALRAMATLRSADEINDACIDLQRHCQNNNVIKSHYPNFQHPITKQTRQLSRFTSYELDTLMYMLQIAAVVGRHTQPKSYHTHRLVQNGAFYKFIPISS